MADVALYYPYVHPRDDGWLKHAVLYWPTIERIVPGGWVEPKTDSVTGKALTDAGILVAREPESAIADVAGALSGFVAARASELSQRYSLTAAEQLPARQAWNDKHLDLRLGWIHRGKISLAAVDTLLATGLATTRDDGVWIGMHPALSDVYMCALTAKLAATGGNMPITDEPLHHVAAAGWTVEDLSRALLPDAHLPAAAAGATDGGEYVVSLALKSFAVRNLADVPVERILKLRDDYHDEFLSFRAKLDQLVRGLSDLDDVTDPQALAHQIDVRYRDEVEADRRKLERELGRQRLDIISTAANFEIAGSGVAAVAALAALGAGTVLTGGATAAATALAAWSTGRKLQDQRTGIRARHASAWLLRIEEDLAPNRLAEQLRRLVRRFTG